MNTSRVFILSLCVIAASLFHACEKESTDANIKTVNADFLLSRILKEGKLYQEYIYNEKKKLVRINYYYDDSVYSYDIFEYNSEGKAIMKNYSDEYYETYEYDQSGRYIKLNVHDNDSEVYKVIEFTYNSEGLREKGVVTYNYGDTYNILYSYDSAGNVIKKEEGPLTFVEFEYDNKNNPRYNWNLPTDIIQKNNPVRYHMENPIMCRIPPSYEYIYEYNSDEYPVIEIRKMMYSEIVDTFYYEYMK